MVTDTRAHPRYALEIDAEIDATGRPIPARTRNISHGGLSVETSRPLTVGSDVTVTISLVFDEQAMSERLPLRGRVVWCTTIPGNQYQIGVTFVGLTGEERLYVELFLRYLSEEP